MSDLSDLIEFFDPIILYPSRPRTLLTARTEEQSTTTPNDPRPRSHLALLCFLSIFFYACTAPTCIAKPPTNASLTVRSDLDGPVISTATCEGKKTKKRKTTKPHEYFRGDIIVLAADGPRRLCDALRFHGEPFRTRRSSRLSRERPLRRRR
jgi:hypothetical protein